MSEARLVQQGTPPLVPMVGRSPGLHVSAIIRDLCIRLGHFSDDDRGIDPADATWMELGNAFEDALALAIARRHERTGDRYCQPGELEQDGIFGTPDLLDVVDVAIVEIKLTWMSARHDIESPKFWRYWVQLMAYCYMAGTDLGRLHVCHINGDYRGSGPIYRVWERKFDSNELAENWMMLRSHGRALQTR